MKKSEVPQDPSDLANANFRELCYATDEQGNYVTEKSTGWEVKAAALSNAVERIRRRTEEAHQRMREGKASPIAYYMELNRMDVQVLAEHVGLWRWRVKRHFDPRRFGRLKEALLRKYADAFNITVQQLKNPDPGA